MSHWKFKGSYLVHVRGWPENYFTNNTLQKRAKCNPAEACYILVVTCDSLLYFFGDELV